MVKDAGVPQKSASAIVIANIENVNDESPIFQQKTYEASVTENAPVSTPGNFITCLVAIKLKHNKQQLTCVLNFIKFIQIMFVLKVILLNLI